MNGDNVEAFKTEQQRADDYRIRAAIPLAELAAIMNEAKRDGFQMSFNIGPDQYGRFVPTPVSIVKPL